MLPDGWTDFALASHCCVAADPGSGCPPPRLLAVGQHRPACAGLGTGGVVEESDYYPFGQERVVTGSGGANNYKYTGHERDAESGLDHTPERQLSSALGRWLSPDRVRGTPANPQSFNRYGYASNNPCNRV